jgi:hypothetical protein
MKERNKNISKLKFLKLNDTKHTRSSTLTHCCVEFCGCPAPMSPSSMAVAWDGVTVVCCRSDLLSSQLSSSKDDRIF